MLSAEAFSAEAGCACGRVVVGCGRMHASVGVELRWYGVMGGRRGAENWTGGVASARAVHRRMSAVRKVRGWAAPAAGVRAVRWAAGMPFYLFETFFILLLTPYPSRPDAPRSLPDARHHTPSFGGGPDRSGLQTTREHVAHRHTRPQRRITSQTTPLVATFHSSLAFGLRSGSASSHSFALGRPSATSY